MLKELKEEYAKRKESHSKVVERLGSKTLEHRLFSLELSNMESLEGFVSYKYMSGLIMTTVEGYCKEAGLPITLDRKEVVKHYISEYASKQPIYQELLKNKPSTLDAAIYTLMTMDPKGNYNYLTREKNRVASLVKEKKELKTTFKFDTTFPPIKGFEFLNREFYTADLSELLMLKEDVQVNIEKLANIQDDLAYHSPSLLSQILEGKYKNEYERVYDICRVFDLEAEDELTSKYRNLVNNFLLQYDTYKSLKFGSAFSKNKKEMLNKVESDMNQMCAEIVKTIKQIIINKIKKALSLFGNYFGTKEDFDYLKDNYYWYTKDIQIFVGNLRNKLETINSQIDIINYRRSQIDEKIKFILDEIGKKVQIKINPSDKLEDTDLFASYQRYHLHTLAREIDLDAIREVRNSYGTISDEYVFRKIPIE